MPYEKKVRPGHRPLSAKEWAWEFLRRNPKYRKAYAEFQELSDLDRKRLDAVKANGFEALRDVAHLSIKWFSFSFPESPRRRGETLKEFIKRAGHWKPVPWVSLHSRFDLETYALADWLDPDVSPLPPEELRKLGVLHLDELRYFQPWTSTDEAEEIVDQENEESADEASDLNDDSEFDSTELSAADDDGDRLSPYAYDGEDESADPEQYEDGGNLFFEQPLRKNSRAETAHYSFTGVTGTKGRKFKNASPIPSMRMNRSTDVLLRIDLNRPLAPQMAAFSKSIATYKAELELEGLCLRLPDRIDRGGKYSTYLDILDLLADGADYKEIAIRLKGMKKIPHLRLERGKILTTYSWVDADGDEITASSSATGDIRKQAERALNLRDWGYLGLAFLDT